MAYIPVKEVLIQGYAYLKVSPKKNANRIHKWFNRCLHNECYWLNLSIISLSLQETNISPKNGILKMIFLFPTWDMLIPWRVICCSLKYPNFTRKLTRHDSGSTTPRRNHQGQALQKLLKSRDEEGRGRLHQGSVVGIGSRT